jgi:hypothetical protein
MSVSRSGGIVVGALIALAVPLTQMVVAFLWDRGVVTLEPNGSFVHSLQAATGLEFALGPVGMVFVGRWQAPEVFWPGSLCSW